MKKIKRYEPKEGDSIDDLLLHQEMLIMWCNMFLDFIKKIAKNRCCTCCDECPACHAQLLLQELGEDE